MERSKGKVTVASVTLITVAVHALENSAYIPEEAGEVPGRMEPPTGAATAVTAGNVVEYVLVTTTVHKNKTDTVAETVAGLMS